MNFDTVLLERIDQYLSSQLPPEEALALEQLAAADPKVAQAIEFVRLEREGLELIVEENLRQRMGAWEADLPDSAGMRTPAKWAKARYTWLLLALALLCAAGWLIRGMFVQKTVLPTDIQQTEDSLLGRKVEPIAKEGEPATEKRAGEVGKEGSNSRLAALAEAQLADFSATVLQQYGTTMGDGDPEAPPLFLEGLAAYKANEYARAKASLSQIVQSDSYYGAAQELLALVFFQEKNTSAAIAAYERFAATNTDPSTQWRLLQLYLADYDQHRAAFWALLNQITRPGSKHPFQKEATDLRRQLKGLAED